MCLPLRVFLGQVASPNEARVYGTGEVIVIEITFNHAVVPYGEPTLVLETGVFNQEVRPDPLYILPWIEVAITSFKPRPFYVSLVISSRKS